MKDAFNIITKKGIKPGSNAFALVRTSAIKIECPTCHGARHQAVVIFNKVKDMPCPTCQGTGSCNGYEIATIRVHSIDILEFNRVYYRDREYMSRQFAAEQMYKTYDTAVDMLRILNMKVVRD